MNTVHAVRPLPAVGGAGSARGWDSVDALPVAMVHPRSSSHRPSVEVRIAADAEAIHLRWTVDDRHVLSRVTELNGPVCHDSCVEFFFTPPGVDGYVNLEINAGGTIHCSYFHAPGSLVRPIAPADATQIGVVSSLPRVIDPELAGPLTWTLTVRLPFATIATLVGRPAPGGGLWRGNFYKCADQCSHPHWLSWLPVGEPFNFHRPDTFGSLRFPASDRPR